MGGVAVDVHEGLANWKMQLGMGEKMDDELERMGRHAMRGNQEA